MADEDVAARRALWRVQIVHTVVWAVFAASIVAIPVATWTANLQAALWLSLLVWVEVLVLVANGMRCPLTGVAERYTHDRSANFDIFLPQWLARHNKLLFGTLFAVGEFHLLWRWWGPPG